MAELVDLPASALSRCGEIGKHVRLKIVWSHDLVGSSPTIGTWLWQAGARDPPRADKLKIPFWQQSEGSIPSRGTKKTRNIPKKLLEEKDKKGGGMSRKTKAQKRRIKKRRLEKIVERLKENKRPM